MTSEIALLPTFEVAPEDGKTMTETGKPVGADEPFTAVYSQQ